MTCVAWVFSVVALFSILAYNRASLSIWTLSFILFLILIYRLTGFNLTFLITLIILGLIFTLLYASSLRRRFITNRLYDLFCQSIPPLSRTERQAISAGTVTWEGDLFRGNPNWEKLLSLPKLK